MILATKRILLASTFVISLACSDDDDTTTGNDPGTANNGASTGGNAGANEGEGNNGANGGLNGSDDDAGSNDPGGGVDAGATTGNSTGGSTTAGSNNTAGGNTAGGTTGSDAGAEDLEDGEIAAVTNAANIGVIKQAELALLRAKAAPVRTFAQNMVTEHNAAQARQAKLLVQLGIIPRDNGVSMMVTQQSGMILGGLEVTSTEAFDLAYIDAQVSFNQTHLKVLDEQLLTSADQMALIDELQTLRTAVQSHLEQAQEIKAELGVNDGG